MSATAIVPASSRPGTTTPGFAGKLLKLCKDLWLPVAAISVIFVMLIPVPSVVLDLLLACSFSASVLVFLSAVQVGQPKTISSSPGDNVDGSIVLIFIGTSQRQQLTCMERSCVF